MSPTVLCIGEVLWDALPGGMFLGGAPFNVACHLHQQKVPVGFCSRVGDDLLGREITRRMSLLGLDDSLVQTDRVHDTGLVVVNLENNESPSYEILMPSAWDFIECENVHEKISANAQVAVFGTLCQRNRTSRETIRKVVKNIRHRVYDVNLRPPYDDREIVVASLELATFVKLNDDEFGKVCSWLGIIGETRERASKLLESLQLEAICITCGADGAHFMDREGWHSHTGPRVEVVDAVGAGDAFLATFLSEYYIHESGPGDSLKRANIIGGYVASQQGATPFYDKHEVLRINDLKRNSG